ncbi:MAG TPA: CPBP family intramembrane glutamic endopeptidase [Terriglobales bacterium]|jgi:membrane protease YdiL (CAAX protease family)|nr:CPBP family intramembrane glutamic endopeptidase [Terriglobales bacterium]
MKSFPSHQRLVIFLLLVLALTCALSPWLALGADWAQARWPGLIDERIPFPRVFNRAFMIAGFIMFIVCRRWLLADELKALVVVDQRSAARGLAIGLGLSIASMILLVVVMSAVDVYTPFFRVSFGDAVGRFFSALAAGAFAGFLEEVFFRGILFQGLRQEGRVLRAYIFANLFYSALHFVKPGESYFLDGTQPLAGFKHLLTTFAPFLDPLPLLPGIFGLFLIGVVLSFALARTGNLYLAVGLHAGWVFSLKMLRVFGDFTRAELGWAFGSTDPKIVSGVATWVGILLVGVAIYHLTRRRADLLAGRPRAREA